MQHVLTECLTEHLKYEYQNDPNKELSPLLSMKTVLLQYKCHIELHVLWGNYTCYVCIQLPESCVISFFSFFFFFFTRDVNNSCFISALDEARC